VQGTRDRALSLISYSAVQFGARPILIKLAERSAPARAYVAAAKKLRNGAAVISIKGKSGLLSKWFGKSDNNPLKPCENLSSTLVARAPA
jgi:hypothetical protein